MIPLLPVLATLGMDTKFKQLLIDLQVNNPSLAANIGKCIEVGLDGPFDADEAYNLLMASKLLKP